MKAITTAFGLEGKVKAAAEIEIEDDIDISNPN
jgi:hypothetical protein